MPQFVYSRTQDHVDRLKALQAKGYVNLTDEELVEYTGYAALGAYNAADINRVETAVAEIAPLFGLALTTSTDRTYWTIPNKYADGFYTPLYLSNVVAIRDAALALDETLVFPVLPDSLDNLTWDLANNIEKTLYLAYLLHQTPTIALVSEKNKPNIDYEITISGITNGRVKSISLEYGYRPSANYSFTAPYSLDISKEDYDTMIGHTYVGTWKNIMASGIDGGSVTWRCRAVLTYNDLNGNTQTIYSDLV